MVYLQYSKLISGNKDKITVGSLSKREYWCNFCCCSSANDIGIENKGFVVMIA